MCKSLGWIQPLCNHRWLSIQGPCHPDANYLNCPCFTSKGVHHHALPRTTQCAPGKFCPICNNPYGGYSPELICMLDNRPECMVIERAPVTRRLRWVATRPVEVVCCEEDCRYRASAPCCVVQ